jgi:hypothetical protein
MLNTLNGCIGYNDMSFSEFRNYIRKRDAYDPNAKTTVKDSEEKRVIREENKIRKEHGVRERKE